MSKRRTVWRFLAIFVVLVVVLAAGWTGLWYVVAGRLADHVLAWEQQRRAEGWTITHGAPSRTGWPMAAGITLPDVAISGGAQYLAGGLSWQARALTLALDVRHPNDLYLGVAGRQSLSVAGGRAIPFQAAKMAGELALLPGDRPGMLRLYAKDLIAALASADGKPEALSVGRLDAAVRADGAAPATADALAVAARMSDVSLPPHLPSGVGRSVRSLSFDAALSGPVPQAGAKPDPTAAAEAWRGAGGSLAVRAVHLADGPLGLDAEGQFRLDADLRPEGHVALRVKGVADTIHGLTASHVLTRAEAQAVTAMLALMMRPPHPDVLQAPLGLRRGVVSLGSIPLIRLPSL